jgi:hypothetical protein
MKKLSSKGFSHLEVLLIIVVIALIGGAGFYVLKNNKHQNTATNQTKTDSTQVQDNTIPQIKVYKSTQYGFSFQYPGDWQLTTDLKDLGRGGPEGDIVVTSPTGTKVHFGPGYGGKGGECIDDNTGTETTRTCSTLNATTVEKITTGTATKPIYFYQASLTLPTRSGGQTSYVIFISNNSFYPDKPGSVMGAIFFPYDEVDTGKALITIQVDGKDSSIKNSKSYFDSAEVKEATPVLKSFTIL